ncbi:hypothetical protein OROHE_019476 [Orobanche hederae]
MAVSVPHQYSSFSTEFCSFPTCEETSNMFHKNNNSYMVAPLMNYDIINSPVSVTSSFPHFDQLLGVNISDSSLLQAVVPVQTSELEMGFSGVAVCDYQQYDQLLEPGDDQECTISALVPNFYSSSMSVENWALIQENNAVLSKAHEETEVKVGRYSAEEKKDRILRYLKKKNQRNFNKTIKYACRKTLADKRVRVRGRFAKNNEPAYCEEDINVMNTSPRTSNYQQNNLSIDDYFKIKYNEDGWLQAAMSNLMHLPYI